MANQVVVLSTPTQTRWFHEPSILGLANQVIFNNHLIVVLLISIWTYWYH
jgi:hypothetical protein